MKKRVIAVLLSICTAAAGVGTSIPVCAAETTADEAAVSEEAEEATAELEEVSEWTENTDTGLTAEASVAEESIVEEPADGEPAGDEAALSSDALVPVEDASAEETESADQGDTSAEAAVTVESPVIEESLEMTKETEALASEVVDSGKCGTNAKWTLTGTGDDLTLTISGSGIMDNYDYADGPWGNRKDVKTLVIEEGITSVGKYAFMGLSGLQQVSLPDTLTVIKRFAFYKCEALEEIRIPEGVTSIEYAAFSGCSSLTDAALPDSVCSIGESVFARCSGLKSIVIPKNVTVIKDDLITVISRFISSASCWPPS